VTSPHPEVCRIAERSVSTFRFFNLQQRVLFRFSWPIGLQSTALSHSKTFFQLRLSLTGASLPPYSSIPCSPWIPMDSHGHTSRNALVRCARMTWACDDVWLISIHIFLSTPEINMSNGFAPSRRGLVLAQTLLCSKKTGTLLSLVRLSV